MSVSVALSAAAIAGSSAATATANRARTDACKSLVQTYQPQGATVAEMHQYAGCVERLYPQDDILSPGGVLLMKVLIVFLFACLVGGVLHGLFWSGRYEDGFDRYVLKPFAWVAAGLIAIVIGALLYAGAAFVLTA
jgi:hypothetical protein